jgi:hypothetical protein
MHEFVWRQEAVVGVPGDESRLARLVETVCMMDALSGMRECGMVVGDL